MGSNVKQYEIVLSFKVQFVYLCLFINSVKNKKQSLFVDLFMCMKKFPYLFTHSVPGHHHLSDLCGTIKVARCTWRRRNMAFVKIQACQPPFLA